MRAGEDRGVRAGGDRGGRGGDRAARGGPRTLKEHLVENLGFKIVALAVALVVWFGVKTDRQTEVTWPVELEVVTRSDDETILTRLPESVEVTFAGTGKELLLLGDQHYRVRKVLERGRPGPRRVILGAGDVAETGNLNVKPVAVEPNVITITVDRVGTKQVPLRAEGEIDPAEGFELAGRVRFEPPAVTLVGARSLLAEIDTIPVDVSALSGAREEVREDVVVMLPDYPNVVVQPDTVRVLADVREAEAPDRAALRGES